MLGCCGAPADLGGQKGLMEENVSLIKKAWTDLGKPTFILACSSCMQNFNKYMEDIDFVSIWELMENLELPKASGQERLRLNIHDPCTSRETKMQDSVRNILSKLNHDVSELKYSKELTKCCGYGGLVYFANRDQAQDFINDRIEESKDDLLVYCAMCKDLFTSRGKRTYHMLDLLFSDDLKSAGLKKMPSLSERQHNRMYVKNSMLKNIWGEESLYEDEKYNIIISDEAKAKMEEMYIVYWDIKKCVENSIEHKERFFDPSKKSYLTRLRIDNVTYWVQYQLKGEDIVVTNVYSHRMEVVEAKNENY
jgi:glutamate synthase (NADPH/NADH) small chain